MLLYVKSLQVMAKSDWSCASVCFIFLPPQDGLVGMAIVGGIGLGVAGLAGLIGLAVAKGAKSWAERRDQSDPMTASSWRSHASAFLITFLLPNTDHSIQQSWPRVTWHHNRIMPRCPASKKDVCIVWIIYWMLTSFIWSLISGFSSFSLLTLAIFTHLYRLF